MTTFIVANWKMNPLTRKEAEELFSFFKKTTDKRGKVIFCPPFPYLHLGENLNLGAQNCFPERKGSFTGEVSPYMLKDLGCDYVIIGHSERRSVLGEDFFFVKRKVETSINAGLTPILCVGEEKREGTDASGEIKEQIRSALERVSFKEIIIAYEPVFAIGTGSACPIEVAAERRFLIEDILSQMKIEKDSVPILYGGSVNAENAKGYLLEGGFQGLLVGGASLEKEEFTKIIESVF